MEKTYHFIAIFDYADDGISIEFPDLPGCYPSANTTEEAIKNAKEAMGLHLWSMGMFYKDTRHKLHNNTN